MFKADNFDVYNVLADKQSYKSVHPYAYTSCIMHVRKRRLRRREVCLARCVEERNVSQGPALSLHGFRNREAPSMI